MINRKITLTFILTFILILGITFLSFHYGIEENQEINNSLLSIMVENEEGKYVKAKENTWSEEYILNEEKSYCTNNSKLSYNEETKKVSLTTKGSEKCWLYFDKEITGTEDNPYKIATIEDLVDLSNEVNQGNNYAGKYVVLTKNLDFKNREDYENPDRIDYGNINGVNGIETLYNELNNPEGSGFMPIGSYNIPFNGVFDGKEHSIKNIYIKPLAQKPVAFFGGVKNSTIKNLNIEGEYIQNLDDESGGIVANLFNSNIDNCISKVNITSYAQGRAVGGVAAISFEDCKITNSINKGTLKYSYSQLVGGIIGCMTRFANKLTIDNCSNEGNIVGELISDYNAGYFTGGIIGRDSGELDSTLIITNSFNAGNLNTFAPNAGGIMGVAIKNVFIENCYNIGEIVGKVRLGGILGYILTGSNVVINKSYNLGTLKEGKEAHTKEDITLGGIIGFNNGNTYVLNSYNEGSIEGNGANQPAGIFGYTYGGATSVVLNSYNVGTVNNVDAVIGEVYITERVANGIFSVSATNASTLKANNVYNLGILTGKYIFGIGTFNNNTLGNVTNAYYKTGLVASNGNVGATSLTEDEMRSETLVNYLNGNIVDDHTLKDGSNNITLTSFSDLLENYSLCGWKLGDKGYPMLEC